MLDLLRKSLNSAAAVFTLVLAIAHAGPAAAQKDELQSATGSRLIYVAPDGSSAASGEASDDALATPEQGFAKLRFDRGDKLLLKRGSDYQLAEAVPAPAGGTAALPTVIGAYGDGDTPTLDVSAAAASFDPSALNASNVVARGVVIEGGWRGRQPRADPRRRLRRTHPSARGRGQPQPVSASTPKPSPAGTSSPTRPSTASSTSASSPST